MTTNNRYTNGKIYQITNNLNDMVYIGSTCLPLRKRWYNHKNEMNYGKGSTRRLFQMAAQIGWDEMRIVLVESYSCDSSDELRRREEYHLQQVPVERRLNMMHAYQTPRLYSYGMVLGCTLSGDYKVMRQMTARTGCFVSQSTSTHSNLAARYADLVYNTRMDIEMHNHLFEID